jgi:hypothetical protein
MATGLSCRFVVALSYWPSYVNLTDFVVGPARPILAVFLLVVALGMVLSVREVEDVVE